MPFGTIKLKPGIETNNTPVLNEAAYSSSQLIRFLTERNGFGLAQKLGGWVAYFNSAIGSKIRALKAWTDLNAINHLGVGAESSLSVITNGNLLDITPRTITTNTSPVFVTTSGSKTVSITDSNTSALTTFDYVEFVTPVAVGGLVLSGPYQIQSVAGTTFTITALTAATSTANTSTNTTAGSFVVGNTYQIVTAGSTNFTLIGAASNAVGTIFNATGAGSGSGTAKLVGVYSFQTTSSSSIVTCYFDNHSYSVGSNFYVGVPLSIGGITLSGIYTVVSVLSASSFTFAASNLATSAAGPTAINGGNVNSIYYVGVAPQIVGTGFGVGGFGVGGFGVGTTTPTNPGTPITATDWTLDNFGQDLIACPAGGPIYYWQPNGSVLNAQILSQQAPLVNSGIFTAMPERQIIAYGSSFTLQADPLLVRWCDIQDFTVWNASSTNQAGSFRIPTGSKIVAGFQGPQQGLLWTDIDVWSMQYVGYPLVYGFNKIGSNCGAISRHCIGQVNNSIYWMSQRNFFLMTGNGVQPMPCPIFDVVFQNINPNYYYKVCCGVNSQFNEVTWYYPSLNSTENDSYVKYNYLVGQWDFGTLSRTAWIDQSGLGPPIGAGGDTYIYQHEVGNDAAVGTTTTPMLSSFQTGFFQLSEGENLVFVDQIWPDMKWGTYSGNQNATVYVTIYYTNYATDTATSPSTSFYAGSPSGQVSSITFPMTQSTEYISCRIRARFMAFALNSQDVGTFWRLGGVKFRYQPDGKF